MKPCYLEVTYRQGKPFSAYLKLPSEGIELVASTKVYGNLPVDFSVSGQPIGIEIHSPSFTPVAEVLSLLEKLKVTGVGADDLKPLAA